MAKYLIDTNVLLRLVDQTASQHGVARAAIKNLLSQDHAVFLAPQNLIEFWAVATRPVENRGLGYEKTKALVEMEMLQEIFALLADPPDLFEHWLRLIKERNVEGKRAHDARLAATLLAHGFDHLVMFNVEDFRTLGISVVSPDQV
jgi:predicted nucleic acid-binding protein